ncbi:hypothetical protein ZWY2020_037495 [Hordeum vulgare]|nr:hypothetical protein ZWY2020_037495 [Hordeum vulgare]
MSAKEIPPEHLEQDQVPAVVQRMYQAELSIEAIPSLVPMLLETLLNQEGYHEHAANVRNISMSGAKCLGLIVRTVGDAIVPLAMPFVKVNITNLYWHCREAATFAFSSILEGPSVEKLNPLVQARLDFSLNSMKDPNNQVIIQKLSNSYVMSVISQTADKLMLMFPCVFACPSSTIHEKAMRRSCSRLAEVRRIPNMLHFCMVLQGAAELVVLDQSNEDTIVHHNQLRHGIFEAYSSILDESVTKAAVAALGDLADILGLISKDLFKIHPFHVELLSECLNSDSEVRERLSSQGVTTANRSTAFLIREIFSFFVCGEGVDGGS